MFSNIEMVEKQHSISVGPGNHYYGLSNRNVKVGCNGVLKLAVAKVNKKFSCAEVYSKEVYGFGVYEFCVEMNHFKFDPSLVLGLFLYNDKLPPMHNEVDVEISKWGSATNENGQYVVFADTLTPLINRFSCLPISGFVIHEINYQPDSIGFKSFVCGSKSFDDRTLIHEFHWCHNPFVANPMVNIRMNLWVVEGAQPNLKNQKVRIHRVKFTPND